jgi:molecular chaperone Hsp33
MSKSSFWTKWIAEDHGIRIVALEATEVCQSIAKTHHLEGEMASHFAESIVGALLIASTHKDNESVNLIVDHSPHFRKQVIDASPEGHVRGFVMNKSTDPLDAATPMLSVVYTKADKNHWPYRGVVEFTDPFIDEALMKFCAQSEQLLTSIGIHIERDQESVTHATGVLVQIVGGAKVDSRELVEKVKNSDLRNWAKTLASTSRFDPKEISPLSHLEFKLMEHSPATYKCPCTKERMLRGLRMLPPPELVELFSEQDPVVATCDFCLTEYRLTKEMVLKSASD